MSTGRKPTVVVTGASGLIGGLVLKNLGERFDFRAVNRRRVEGVPCWQADVADFDAIRPAFEGADAVVHLSAYTQDIHQWEGTLSVNIVGTYNVFEAARQAGVRRVVFASSGSTMLGYEKEYPYGELARGEYEKVPDKWTLITHLWPVRPDSIYGVSKVFGEVLGRYYSDYHGLSVVCLRIGAVLDTDRPKLVRHFPGYLSQADIVQAIRLALEAPESLRYTVCDIISDNRWRWRDIEHARRVLGYVPTGSSDGFTL